MGLTYEQIMRLEGRELDFAIEEMVFGGQWWTTTCLNSASLLPPELTEEALRLTDMVPGRRAGTNAYCPFVPAYSTWEAYGRVFAEMERRGYAGELTRDFARFSQGAFVGEPVFADAPLAVTRAALLALYQHQDQRGIPCKRSK